ncbi:MAG: DDE-type integrase/transposase/recombinase [Christensenellales bacterium]|jgi:transposase InsO family protein
MSSITQDMRYRQSVMEFALRHGVSRASRRHNRVRSYIYFWLKRYDGTLESLACRSRRPHSHPNQHTEEEKTLLRNMCRRNPRLGRVELWCRLRDRGYTRTLSGLYRVLHKLDLQPKPQKKPYKPKPYQQMTFPGERVQIDVKVVPRACKVGEAASERLVQYTAIDEYSRLRYLKAYKEQSTDSSKDFLLSLIPYFLKRGIEIQCIQTDNGFEFTNRLSLSQTHRLTAFEVTAETLGIYLKHIRPYTPRHNGKVERSHREDQKRFYNQRKFYSFDDFARQLAAWQPRSNQLPMRPLGFLSPVDFLKQYTVQHV